jgi:hypothetical protein
MMDTFAARNDLPSFLIVKEAKYGYGVFAVDNIPSGTRLGQYKGPVERRRVYNPTYYFEVQHGSKLFYGINPASAEKPTRKLKTVTVNHSGGRVELKPEEQLPNWVRFINSVDPCIDDMSEPNAEPNVRFYQYKKRIYIKTTQKITASPSKPEELLGWYGPDYF